MDDPNNPAPVSTPAPNGVTLNPEQLAGLIRGEIEKATAPLIERLANVEKRAADMKADYPGTAKRDRWLDKIMGKYFAHEQPTDAEMANAG